MKAKVFWLISMTLITLIVLAIEVGIYSLVAWAMWEYVLVPNCGFIMLTRKQAVIMGLLTTFLTSVTTSTKEKK